MLTSFILVVKFVGLTEKDDDVHAQVHILDTENKVSDNQLFEEQIGAYPYNESMVTKESSAVFIGRTIMVEDKEVPISKCLRLILNDRNIFETSQNASYAGKTK
eukprot:2162545-Ditylum_brightwellii.AAC.1